MPDEFEDLLKAYSPAPKPLPKRPVAPGGDKVSFHAGANGVDENLVRALIGQESSGNPRARSWTNAHHGKMQVSQDVVNQFVKPEEFGTLDPYNEDVNLAAGTRYLKHLFNKYNGDYKRVLAGYNAGEGNADKPDWWNKSLYWSNSKDVQAGKLPRGYKYSTREYIDKISDKYKGGAPRMTAPPDIDDLISNYSSQSIDDIALNYADTEDVKPLAPPSPTVPGAPQTLSSGINDISDVEKQLIKDSTDQALSPQMRKQASESLAKLRRNNPPVQAPAQALPEAPAQATVQPEAQSPAETSAVPSEFARREIKDGDSYYEFEKTGKLGDFDYLGTANNKHYFANQDKDVFEGDLSAGKISFIPTAAVKTLRFKSADGSETVFRKSDNQENVKDGTRYLDEAKVPYIVKADGTAKPEHPEKMPLMIEGKNGDKFLQMSNQEGLRPNETRVRRLGNDKGGVMIATKSKDGKYSLRPENGDAAQQSGRTVMRTRTLEKVNEDAANQQSAPDDFNQAPRPSEAVNTAINLSQKPQGQTERDFVIDRLSQIVAEKYGLNPLDAAYILRQKKIGIGNIADATSSVFRDYADSVGNIKINVDENIVQEMRDRRKKLDDAFKARVESGQELSPGETEIWRNEGISEAEIKEVTGDGVQTDVNSPVGELAPGKFGESRKIGEEVRRAQKIRAEEIFEETKDKYEAPELAKTLAEIEAAKEVGWIKPEKAEEAKKQEIAAYNQISKETAEDTALSKKNADAGLDANDAKVSAGMAVSRNSKTYQPPTLQEILDRSGSFQGEIINRERERAEAAAREKRIQERSTVSPLYQPLEFAKNFARSFPKGAASVLKSIDIAAEVLSPANIFDTAAKLYSDQPTAQDATKGIFYQAGHKIEELNDKYLAQDEDLKNDKSIRGLIVQSGDTLGQVISQVGLGIVTGGAAAPVIFGAAMGASEQYDEAVKSGAGSNQRKLAAIVGGAAAITDAIPFAKILKPLGAVERLGFFGKFLGRIFTDTAAEVGEKEAVEVVRSAFRNALVSAWRKSKTLAVDSALEGTQELSEKKINDAVAAMTYDPKRKVFVLNSDDLQEFLGGAIGGIGGGVMEIALESQKSAKPVDAYSRELLKVFKFDTPEQNAAEVENLAAKAEKYQPKPARAVSPMVRKNQVEKMTALGYSNAQIDSIKQSDAKAITENNLTPEEYGRLDKLSADIRQQELSGTDTGSSGKRQSDAIQQGGLRTEKGDDNAAQSDTKGDLPAEKTDGTDTAKSLGQVDGQTDASGVKAEKGGDLLTEEEFNKLLDHPNPDLNGKPVIAETADGKQIVANPNNKSGVSVVKPTAQGLSFGKRKDNSQVIKPAAEVKKTEIAAQQIDSNANSQQSERTSSNQSISANDSVLPANGTNVSAASAAPIVRQKKDGTNQSKDGSQTRTVNVNNQTVTLTPEQNDRWMNEIEPVERRSKEKFDRQMAQAKKIEAQGDKPRAAVIREDANRERKTDAIQLSAIKREIAGVQTEKEQTAKDKREASNYIGKEVSVDGKNAKVVGNPFGKVKVKFEDGTKKTFEQDKISAPVESVSQPTTSNNFQITKPDEYFIANGRRGYEKVNGSPVKIDGFPQIEAFSHAKDGEISISEATTGTFISTGKTLEEAKDNAADAMNNVGPEAVLNRLSSVREKSGFSPRYARTSDSAQNTIDPRIQSLRDQAAKILVEQRDFSEPMAASYVKGFNGAKQLEEFIIDNSPNLPASAKTASKDEEVKQEKIAKAEKIASKKPRSKQKPNPAKHSLATFVRLSGGIRPSSVIDTKSIKNSKQGKFIINSKGPNVEDAFRNAVEAGYFYGQNTEYSPNAADSGQYDFDVNNFVEAVADDANGSNKYYSSENEFERELTQELPIEDEKFDEAIRFGVFLKKPEITEIIKKLESSGEISEDDRQTFVDIGYYENDIPREQLTAFIANAESEFAEAQTPEGAKPSITEGTTRSPESGESLYAEEIDESEPENVSDDDLSFDFSDEESASAESENFPNNQYTSDLFGQEVAPTFQADLFAGESPRAESIITVEKVEAVRDAFGDQTADILGEMLHSKDKAIEKAALDIIDAGKIVKAKGDAATQIVADAADAVELFRTAKQQKSSVSEVLSQPRLDGVEFSDKAKSYAQAMEQGNFASVYGRDLSNAKTETVSPVEKTNDAERKIEDYGEKIGGAKKDLVKVLNDVTSDDIKNKPLSKSFPRPDYAKLFADGVVTREGAKLLKFLYDNIPPKPRKSYRVASWAKTVENAIEATKAIIENGNTKDIDFAQKLKSYTDNVFLKDKYDIYSRTMDVFGFPEAEANLGDYEIKKFYGRDGYNIVKGSFLIKDFPTVETAAEGLKSILDKNKDSAKSVSFSVYQDRNTKDFFIGKKGSLGVVRVMEGFKSSKEAFDFVKSNQAELETLWNARKINPDERNDANRDRIGTDYRAGANVTAEKFADTFGFRGIEFGNWVNNAERQNSVNEAFDALMDMATALGISPRAVSLGGELAIAFGSRGSGKAAAHYERDKVVINLTKTKGKGSLGHEWWHALDNYFSRMRGQEDNFLTENPRQRINRDGTKDVSVRTEMIDAFRDVMAAINESKLSARSEKLDEARSKRYWSTPIEMSARSFENFLIHKLAETNERNDYLANFKEASDWINQRNLDLDNYPYPLESESEALNGAFQNLFDAIQEEKGENGNIVLKRIEENLPIDYETIKTADPVDVIRAAKIERDADRLKLNLEAQEILRRAWEETKIKAGSLKLGGKRVESSFSGAFYNKAQSAELVRTLQNIARDARDNGYAEEAKMVENIAAEIEAARKAGQGTAVAYLLDSRLPHEVFHQASYLGDATRSLNSRHAKAAELDSHPALLKAKQNYFDNLSEYKSMPSGARKAVIREEVAAYIAGGESDILGLSTDEAADYLLNFFDSYAEKNGIESLDNFEKVSEDVQELVRQIKQSFAARASEKSRGSGGEVETGSKQIDAGAPGIDEEISGQQAAEPTAGGKGQKLRSLPQTFRENGLAANDEYYDSLGDTEAKAEARRMLKDLDVRGAMELLKNVSDPDATHAQLAFLINTELQERANNIEATDPAEAQKLREIQSQFTRDLARKYTKAGRFVSAARTVSHSATGVVISAQAILQETQGEDKSLTTEQIVHFETLGKNSEEAQAELELVKKKLANAQASRLEDEAEGKPRTRTAASNVARAKIVDLIKKKQGANNTAVIAKLQEKLKGKALEVLKRVEENVGSLLAPNGKRSNLTPFQYNQVRTDEFKQWFGDWENDAQNASKVVDENGEPLVVYHGTGADFDVFSKETKTKNFKQSTLGFYFTTGAIPNAAKNIPWGSTASEYALLSKGQASVLPVFLNIKTPIEINADGSYSPNAAIDKQRDTIKAQAEADNSYDGVMSRAQDKKQYGAEIIYVAFEPSQIKSATGNNGNFSLDEDSILKRVEESAHDFDQETLDEFAEAGAYILTEGIGGKPETYLPDQFFAEMTSLFGDSIRPVMNEIYYAALEKRSQWINDVRREQIKSVELKKYGDEITDEQVDEILQTRRESSARKRAIELAHSLVSGFNKNRVNDALRQAIAESSANDEISQAALILAGGADKSTFYERLSRLGIEKPKHEQLLVDGKTALDKAKDNLKKNSDKLRAEAVKNSKVIRDIEAEMWAARRKAQAAQESIAQEFKKLKDGKLWFYTKAVAGSVPDALNNLQASMEISFALRQYGRYLASEPLRAMVNTVSGVITRNPYDYKKDFKRQYEILKTVPKTLFKKNGFGSIILNIEANPLFREAVKMGVNFSTAGKFGTGEQTGEEQLNSSLVGKIPLYGKAIEKFDDTMASMGDALRMMMYEHMATALKYEGLKPEKNSREFEEIAKEINRGTGKANKFNNKIAQSVMTAVNKSRLFRAANYTVSNWQKIGADTKNIGAATANLVLFKSLPKGAQKQIVQRALYSHAVLGMQYALMAAAFGAVFSFDPDDDDFLKFKWGKYRYDVSFGLRSELKQIARLFVMFKRGSRVPNENTYDLVNNALRYGRSKLGAFPSFMLDAFLGKDFLGKEVNLTDWHRWLNLFAPMTYSNAFQTYEEHGLLGVTYTLPFEFLGSGVSVYEDRPDQATTEAEKLALKIKQMSKSWFNPREYDLKVDSKTWQEVSELKARSRKGEDVSAELKSLQDKGLINKQIFDDVMNAQGKTLLEELVTDGKLDEKQIEAILEVANDEEKSVLQEIIENKRETKQKTVERENNKEVVIELILEMNKLPATSRDEVRARDAEITKRLEELKKAGVIEVSDYAKIRQRINSGETRAIIEMDAARSPEKVISIFEKAFQKADEKEKAKLIKKLEEKRNNAKDKDNRYKYQNAIDKYNPKSLSNKPIFQGRESNNVIDARKFARRPS